MKMLNFIGLGILVLLMGCSTRAPKTTDLQLSVQEQKDLKEQKRFEISDELRKRIIANSKELKLTPEEMLVFKKTGKIVLCGKCGYILNSLKYKAYESGKIKPETDEKTGFPQDSIRDRMIRTFTN